MPRRRRAFQFAVTVLVAIPAIGLSAVACGGPKGETRILDIDPRVGATVGQQPVKILGENFRTDIGYTVYFGSKRAQSVTILDPETLLVMTPQVDEPKVVDVMVRADDGPAWRIEAGYKFEEMGGSVVEGLGSTSGPTKAIKQRY
jgi:hypothetical protein